MVSHEVDVMTASILVADDNPSLVAVLTQVLIDDGSHVRAAYDGEAALHAIAVDEPDLIVSNVSMSRLDWVTLTKRLQAQGRQIPVILVSAEVLGVDLPSMTFLAKPVDLDEFCDLVAHLLAAAHCEAARSRRVC